jgi:hypothetical protein
MFPLGRAPIRPSGNTHPPSRPHSHLGAPHSTVWDTAALQLVPQLTARLAGAGAQPVALLDAGGCGGWGGNAAPGGGGEGAKGRKRPKGRTSGGGGGGEGEAALPARVKRSETTEAQRGGRLAMQVRGGGGEICWHARRLRGLAASVAARCWTTEPAAPPAHGPPGSRHPSTRTSPPARATASLYKQALRRVLPWAVFGPAFEPALWPDVRLFERPVFTQGEDECMWIALTK